MDARARQRNAERYRPIFAEAQITCETGRESESVILAK